MAKIKFSSLICIVCLPANYVHQILKIYQVKSIQDAIRDKKERFIFEGVEISLVPTVGIFITMNPGYAGRTELPENLKVLSRNIIYKIVNPYKLSKFKYL